MDYHRDFNLVVLEDEDCHTGIIIRIGLKAGEGDGSVTVALRGTGPEPLLHAVGHA